MNLINYFKNGSWKGALQGTGMKIAAAKPEIMLVVGALSLLAGTIEACRKTEEAKKIAADTKQDLQTVEEMLKIEETDQIKMLPETKKQLKIERGKQYLKVYGHMVYQYTKLYGVAAMLWFGGMGMVFGGHHDLRMRNRHLAADIFAGNQLLREYRERVAKAVGEETEKKIYMGAQEGMVNVLEKDEQTGEEKIVQKKADVFYAQPGSIFAMNFTPENTDIFYRTFTDEFLDSRADKINKELELGVMRAYNALDICRMLGYNENAFGSENDPDHDEKMKRFLSWGISGNARKVPDPEMRKLKITRLRGYQKRWDVARNMEVYEPCLRLDFNFYPLEGKI